MTDNRRGCQCTSNQTTFINNVLRDHPEMKELHEYADWLAKPNRGTASDLITRIIEDVVSSGSGRADYARYIATRPGAELIGGHGLFGAAGNDVSLAAVADEVSTHTGNIWTAVISPRGSDSAALGYDNVAAWQTLLRNNVKTIADAYNIAIDNLQWYAAVHHSANPHVHLIVYSKNPTEGFLKPDGVKMLKSVMVNTIFRDELYHLYDEQHRIRKDVALVSQDVLDKQLTALQYAAPSGELQESLITLAVKLRGYTGRRSYGYLPAQLKKLVDQTVDQLAKIPEVNQVYQSWLLNKNQITSYYKPAETEIRSMSQQGDKLYRQVKNQIINAAGQIDIEDPTAVDTADLIEGVDWGFDPGNLSVGSVSSYIDYNATIIAAELDRLGYLDDYTSDDLTTLRLSVLMAKDPDKRHDLYIKMRELALNNPLAKIDAGRMALDGFGCQRNLALAQAWVNMALDDLRELDQSAGMTAVEYITEYDYDNAPDDAVALPEKKWWTEDYCRAREMAAGPDRLGLLKQLAEEGNPMAAYDVATMLARGSGCNQDLSAASAYFRRAADGIAGIQTPYYLYRLGLMHLRGEGMTCDVAEGIRLIALAAKTKQYARSTLDRLLQSRWPKPDPAAGDPKRIGVNSNRSCGTIAAGLLCQIGQMFRPTVQHQYHYSNTHTDTKIRQKEARKKLASGQQLGG